MISETIKNWIRTEMFDQVPLSICVIDRNFKVVEANKTFTDTYGHWQGQYCHKVYKDRDERCSHCAAVKTFADGKVRTREEQGVVRNGKPTYYFVQMVPLVRENGEIPYVVEMSTDISEMKQLQQEKLTAERLAAVGQTVAGLAHGIKNVIMGLEGGMYVVNSGIKRNDSEKIRQGWEMLEENIYRISSFVKEFLDFARGRTPTVKVVDPNHVARQIYNLYKDSAAQSDIELSINLDETIAEAPLDEEGIHTCLANLVSNALDACEMSDKPGNKVTIATRESDGDLIYEVTDNGCGMDYDIKQKVFSNFFSTKGSGKGTGLGLLTTRKIVQEHGGAVSFDSTEGVGSVFLLRMPRDRLPQPTEDSGSK